MRLGIGAQVRGLLVFLSVFATLPVALVFPFAGVLLWAWLSFANPHREAFGIAANFNFNFYVAIVTLVAWMISREPKRIPSAALPVLFSLFAIMFSLSTYFALDYAHSLERWNNHIRTILLVLVVMSLANSKLRIQAFLWICAISIGYYAAQGGGIVLITGGGGGSRIFGPEGTAIAGNNELAVALCMFVPIFNYLRTTSANHIVKTGSLIVMCLAVLAVVGTYSRSGFISLVTIGIMFVLFSRPRIGAFLVPVALGLAIWNYAPTAWFKRIQSIQTYQEDESVTMRFAVWETNWRIALDRPLIGGGFAASETKAAYRYTDVDWKKEEDDVNSAGRRAAHSIYLAVIGDHGFIGFGLWASIILVSLFNLVRILSLARDRPDLAWARVLARALIVSIFAYLTGGTFLNMAYYDAFYCLLALTVPLREVVAGTARSAAADIDDEPVDDLVPALRTASWKRST